MQTLRQIVFHGLIAAGGNGFSAVFDIIPRRDIQAAPVEAELFQPVKIGPGPVVKTIRFLDRTVDQRELQFGGEFAAADPDGIFSGVQIPAVEFEMPFHRARRGNGIEGLVFPVFIEFDFRFFSRNRIR